MFALLNCEQKFIKEKNKNLPVRNACDILCGVYAKKRD